MKEVLFIDRDGTIIKETADEQIDSFEKITFYPKVFQYLSRIAKELDFEIVMITNQDGLGTSVFPEDTFWPVHNFIVKTFEDEGIVFKEQYIDRTFAKDNAPTRKPNTGLLTQYFSSEYDLENSFVSFKSSTPFTAEKPNRKKSKWTAIFTIIIQTKRVFQISG